MNQEGLILNKSTASFSCDEDYRLCGTEVLICSATNEWHRPIPACKAYVFFSNLHRFPFHNHVKSDKNDSCVSFVQYIYIFNF